MKERLLEFRGDKSEKFWAIEMTAAGFVVRYGKIGTEGRTQEKTFASADEAKEEADKLIAQKCKKGYREVGKSKSDAASKTPRGKKVSAKTEGARAVGVDPVKLAEYLKYKIQKSADLPPLLSFMNEFGTQERGRNRMWFVADWRNDLRLEGELSEQMWVFGRIEIGNNMHAYDLSLWEYEEGLDPAPVVLVGDHDQRGVIADSLDELFLAVINGFWPPDMFQGKYEGSPDATMAQAVAERFGLKMPKDLVKRLKTAASRHPAFEESDDGFPELLMEMAEKFDNEGMVEFDSAWRDCSYFASEVDEEFWVFAQTGSGGLIAQWEGEAAGKHTPVVLLGDEGELGVLALTVDDFCLAILSGYEIYALGAQKLQKSKKSAALLKKLSTKHGLKQQGLEPRLKKAFALTKKLKSIQVRQ